MSKKTNILVCGGGNGAHCFTAIACTREGADVSVLTLYEDEAERWTQKLKDKPLTATFVQNDGSTIEITAKPSVITNDPSLVVPKSDIIFLVVPAFAHEQYLKAIEKHVEKDVVIVGLPARCGFEFQCLNILGDKAKKCAIISFETLPWACRIEEFGTNIRVLGTKESVSAAILNGILCSLEFSVSDKMQWILGEDIKVYTLQNYMAITLMPSNCIHPSIMYGKWRKWDGEPLAERPLFYQGVDEIQAECLGKVSREIVAVAKEIERKRKGIDMKDIVPLIEWYKVHYKTQIADDSNLLRALQTNKAYDGLLHPMKQTAEYKYVPDFSYRYMSEDIPFGLVVIKGVADIVRIQTPYIDQVLIWAQERLGKEYIVGSELKGKDLHTSRVPQIYGFKTLDDLFHIGQS